MSRRAAIALAVLACAGAAFSQGPLAFRSPADHPAIAYSSAPLTDAVSVLNTCFAAGSVRLPYAPGGGFLPAVLQALRVPEESLIAVVSPTSLQSETMLS